MLPGGQELPFLDPPRGPGQESGFPLPGAGPLSPSGRLGVLVRICSLDGGELPRPGPSFRSELLGGGVPPPWLGQGIFSEELGGVCPLWLSQGPLHVGPELGVLGARGLSSQARSHKGPGPRLPRHSKEARHKLFTTRSARSPNRFVFPESYHVAPELLEEGEGLGEEDLGLPSFKVMSFYQGFVPSFSRSPSTAGTSGKTPSLTPWAFCPVSIENASNRSPSGSRDLPCQESQRFITAYAWGEELMKVFHQKKLALENGQGSGVGHVHDRRVQVPQTRSRVGRSDPSILRYHGEGCQLPVRGIPGLCGRAGSRVVELLAL